MDFSGTPGMVSRISGAQTRALKKCRSSFTDGSTAGFTSDQHLSPHDKTPAPLEEQPDLIRSGSTDRKFLEHLERLLERYSSLEGEVAFDALARNTSAVDSPPSDLLDRPLLSMVISSLTVQKEILSALGVAEIISRIERFNSSRGVPAIEVNPGITTFLNF